MNTKEIIVLVVIVVTTLVVSQEKIASFVSNLSQPTTQTVTSQPNNTCNEQDSLSKVTSCTYLLEPDIGHGRGFYLSEGYIVTNRHVIEGASEIFTWIDENDTPLTLWGYSQDEDVARLKAPFDAVSCEWADSGNIPLAQTLYVSGWPGAPEGESSITRGIYSRSLKAI